MIIKLLNNIPVSKFILLRCLLEKLSTPNNKNKNSINWNLQQNYTALYSDIYSSDQLIKANNDNNNNSKTKTNKKHTNKMPSNKRYQATIKATEISAKWFKQNSKRRKNINWHIIKHGVTCYTNDLFGAEINYRKKTTWLDMKRKHCLSISLSLYIYILLHVIFFTQQISLWTLYRHGMTPLLSLKLYICIYLWLSTCIESNISPLLYRCCNLFISVKAGIEGNSHIMMHSHASCFSTASLLNNFMVK